MQIQTEPRIDAWYRSNNGGTFKVVAVDNADGTVEVQHFGGEVEELSLSAWYGMELEQVDAPEDWTGPFDDLVRDDIGDGGLGTRPSDWNGPWDELDRGDLG